MKTFDIKKTIEITKVNEPEGDGYEAYYIGLPRWTFCAWGESQVEAVKN